MNLPGQRHDKIWCYEATVKKLVWTQSSLKQYQIVLSRCLLDSFRKVFNPHLSTNFWQIRIIFCHHFVHFNNILWAAFTSMSWRSKKLNLNFSTEQLLIWRSYEKAAKKCWWNWHKDDAKLTWRNGNNKNFNFIPQLIIRTQFPVGKFSCYKILVNYTTTVGFSK